MSSFGLAKCKRLVVGSGAVSGVYIGVCMVRHRRGWKHRPRFWLTMRVGVRATVRARVRVRARARGWLSQG